MQIIKRYKAGFLMIILLLITQLIFSQNLKKSSRSDYSELFKVNPDFSLETIRFNHKISLTLGKFVSGTSASTLIEVPILFKYKITDKLSALFGPKFDFYIDEGVLSDDVGVSASFGLQYDVNKKSFIQLNYNYQLNNPMNNMHYNSDKRGSFNLKSGFKF